MCDGRVQFDSHLIKVFPDFAQCITSRSAKSVDPHLMDLMT